MDAKPVSTTGGDANTYLVGKGAARFAYFMTTMLMIIDYIDRQIIVSMFPFLKSQWNLSDTELGSLVSVVSLTVALFGETGEIDPDRSAQIEAAHSRSDGMATRDEWRPPMRTPSSRPSSSVRRAASVFPAANSDGPMLA